LNSSRTAKEEELVQRHDRRVGGQSILPLADK
jgi:hypothetical protein